MKKLFFVAIIGSMYISCGSATTSETSKDTIEVKQEVPAASTTVDQLDGCYVMIIEKDSAHLKLEVNGSAVTGMLDYKRFEKDSNKGTIAGTVENDLIKIWYTFQSEGMVSVREVYLKIIGDKLAEGYGDVDMRNDSFYFKYPTTLRYEDKHPFLKVACN